MSHTQNDVLALAKTVKKNNTNIFKALKAKGIGVESYDSSNFSEAINSWTPTPKVTIPNGMKFANSTIESFPDSFDFSEVTNFDGLFSTCISLTSVPDVTYSGSLSNTFNNCTSLASIPNIDWENVTSFGNGFYNCQNLTGNLTITGMTKCWSLGYAFYNTGFSSIEFIDTANIGDYSVAFVNCSNLTSITGLNITNTGYVPSFHMGNMWTPSNNTILTTLTFSGSIDTTLDLQYCVALSYDSVVSILTAASNTDNSDAKTLTFNLTVTDQDGELAALVSTCEGLGWTISGLTIN